MALFALVFLALVLSIIASIIRRNPDAVIATFFTALFASIAMIDSQRTIGNLRNQISELEAKIIEQPVVTVFQGESYVVALGSILKSKTFGGLASPVVLEGLPRIVQLIAPPEYEGGSTPRVIVVFEEKATIFLDEVEMQVRDQLGVAKFQDFLENEFSQQFEPTPNPLVGYVKLGNSSTSKVPANEPRVKARLRRAVARIDTEQRMECTCDGSTPESLSIKCTEPIDPGEVAYLRVELPVSVSELVPGVLGGRSIIEGVEEAERFPNIPEEAQAFVLSSNFWFEPSLNEHGRLRLIFDRFTAIELSDEYPSAKDLFLELRFSTENLSVTDFSVDEAHEPGVSNWESCLVVDEG